MKKGAPSGMFPAALSSGAWPSIRKNAPPRRRLKRRRRENAKNRSAREGNKRTEFREGRILLEPFRAGNKLRNGLTPLHTGEPFRARGTSCGCRSCPSGQANRSAREKLSKATDGGHGIPPKAWKPHPRRRTGEPLRARGTEGPYGKTTPRRRETRGRGKTSLRAALPSIRRTTPPRNPAHAEHQEEGFDKDESL